MNTESSSNDKQRTSDVRQSDMFQVPDRQHEGDEDRSVN
jgi:hypothetical protein